MAEHSCLVFSRLFLFCSCTPSHASPLFHPVHGNINFHLHAQGEDSGDDAAGTEAGDAGESATGDGGDGVLSIVDGEEIGGVVFSTIASRRPELKRELGILRQELLLEEQSGAGGGDGDGDSEELKVYP